VLFALCAAALLAAFALLAGEGAEERRAERRLRPAHAVAFQPWLPRRRAAGEVRPAAARFLRAFLAYEGGRLSASTKRALRRGATASFAADLLHERPRRLGPRLPPAQLAGLAITPLAAHPPTAVISGSARRGDESEELSFLFKDYGGRWRASGLGE
jgi:hypothetical protein